jgi:hypothetical protein
VYRVDDVACRREGARIDVRVTLFRANATQASTSASVARLALSAGDAQRYAPSDVVSVACDGADECEVLDPGNSRIDVIAFVLPSQAAVPWRFEAHAQLNEPGPRATTWAVNCSTVNDERSAALRR